jgi:hypothetical protein
MFVDVRHLGVYVGIDSGGASDFDVGADDADSCDDAGDHAGTGDVVWWTRMDGVL